MNTKKDTQNKKLFSLFESCPARSKAPGSEPILVGVRAFESHLSHQLLNDSYSTSSVQINEKWDWQLADQYKALKFLTVKNLSPTT
jgi:hypothetical protein